MNRDDSNTESRNVRNLSKRYSGCLWSLESIVLIDLDVAVAFAVVDVASSPPDRLENA